MAKQCDDLFQQLQALEEKKRLLQEAGTTLDSIDPKQGPRPEDPASRFFFKDRKTGRSLEADFDQLMDVVRGLSDENLEALIDQAIGVRAKPIGSEGQFQNFGQLVDRMGIDGAKDAAELVAVLTGTWRKANPEDFARVTRINDKAEFAQRLADSYAEAGMRIDLDTITQGIAKHAVPFTQVLASQTRLQVFSQVTRNTLVKRIDGLVDAITETGLKPTLEQMKEFSDAATKAIFAERSAAMSRRVSGQLLQQLKNDPTNAPAIAGRVLQDELKKEANELFGGYENLATGETVVGRVYEAAERGVDGVEDLKKIRETVIRDGSDPTSRLDKDMKQLWRRNARGYYKDSQLFNLNTQAIASYLSNKMVYVGEGYRSIFQSAQALRPEIKGSGFSRVARQLLPGDLKGGFEVTWQSSFLANDVISKAWKDALGDDAQGGLLASWKAAMEDTAEGRMPFGAAADERGGPVMSIEDQYKAARQVLYGETGAPASGSTAPGWSLDKFKSSVADLANEPNYRIPIAIRDKFFLSMKLLGNHIIENSYKTVFKKEIRMPVTPALQLLAGVDQRAGLRAYMTIRANDLLIKNKLDPALKDLSWAERKAMVRQELEDQLYQMSPSDQNVADYREIHDIGGLISDDDVREMIINEKIGMPVLKTDEQRAAFQRSQEMRMQTPPEKGWLAELDRGVMRARENDYVDALLPYWRSPMASALWEMKFAMPPIKETAGMIFNLPKGIQPSDEQMAKVAASWYAWLGLITSWGVLESTGAIEGSITGDPKAAAQSRAAGNNPNSIFGISGLKNVPIVKAMMLSSDLKKAVEQGLISKYDRKNIFMGLFQVFSGQLLRETGFSQFASINEAVTSQDPQAWMRTFGFMAGGQINPGSGLLRQIERIGGVTQRDMYPTRWTNPNDRFIEDQAGVRQPWSDQLEFLENLRFNLAPSLSGQPLKQKDYLGRRLRMFEGVFAGEWPVGFPGMWDSPVHATLERLQMLQPPAPLMTGRLKGLPMTSDLEVEYNDALAKPAPVPMSEHPMFQGRMRWRNPQGGDVDLSPLMTRITDGATLYEALNGLFQSDAWKSWEADPNQTTNRSVADAPRAEVMKRIGPKAVKLLHDYYDQLATEQVMESNSAAAKEWKVLFNQKNQMVDPMESQIENEALQQAVY